MTAPDCATGAVPGSVVVVGGGIAGVSTVSALRAGGYDGALTLVDPAELPYDRPPLSKDYLSGARDLKQITLQPAEWYEEQDVDLLSHTRATAVHADDGFVDLDDGHRVRGDRIVLATGGRAARPPIPGIDSSRVHVLRTVEDADGLRAALTPGVRCVVVGAGLIGAEVASTMLALDAEVTLIDPVATPLAPVLGTDVAAWLHGLHSQHGIKSLTCGVERFEDTGGTLRVALAERDVEADLVVLGVGMVPDTGLAEGAGLKVDRGVLVDEGQVTSHPRILAVGDPARPTVAGLPAHRPEHWDAAQRDAARAAATIMGQPLPTETASWFWTDRHGLHVEVVGTLAGAAQVVVRGELGSDPFSVFAVVGRQVVGAVAVNDSLAVRAARRLIDRAVDVDPAALGDTSIDLRRLVRG